MIDFNVPPLVGTEMTYVREAVEDNHKICGDGPFTQRCDAWIEEHFNARKSLLTTSGTTALEMAAILCGINPGDEVILPSFTFSSTATAFVLVGAKLVFVDIRPDTMNIDESKIEAAITARTRAIVVVHYAGVACEMDTIMDIAHHYDLKVVEDAAQGVMSTYKGKAPTLPQQQILNRAQDTYSKQPGWALLFCQVYRMLCALYCVVCANIWGGLRERRGGRCF